MLLREDSELEFTKPNLKLKKFQGCAEQDKNQLNCTLVKKWNSITVEQDFQLFNYNYTYTC